MMKADIYQYFKTVMDKLNTQRTNNEFCDVTLVSENKEFPVHKAILVACSDYFNAMFHSNMAENEQAKVKINSISPECLKLCITHMYTGSVLLTEENSVGVLDAACYFQIEQLKETCIEYFLNSITPVNCIELLQIAVLYSSDILEVTVDTYIKSNINNLPSDVMKELPLKTIKEIVFSQDEGNNNKEDTLLKSIILWGKNNNEEEFLELLSYIKFGSISKNYLCQVINEEEIVFKNTKICNIFMRALAQTACPFKEYLNEDSKISRGNNILIVYKRNNHALFQFSLQKHKLALDPRRIFHENSSHAQEVCSQCFADNTLYSHCINEAQYDSEEYDSDGYGYQMLARLSTSYIHERKFAVSEDSTFSSGSSCIWTVNVQPRSLSTLIKVDNFLIIIGGCEIDNSFPTDKVNCLDLNLHTCSVLKNMNCSRASLSVENLNGVLYAIGGNLGNYGPSVSSAERYNWKKNEWSMISPMNVARAAAGCASLYDNIYIVGGIDNELLIASAEFYSVKTNTWTMISSIANARSNVSACAVGDKIYIVGGNSSKTKCDYEYYNIQTDTWKCSRTRGNLLSACLVNVITRSNDSLSC